MKAQAFIVLFLFVFAAPCLCLAEDTDRDEAMAAVWDDWKLSLQHSPLQELAVDLDGGGKEYVIAWPEGSNPDLENTVIVTISYIEGDAVHFKEVILPVNTEGEFSLCSKDITLSVEPMTPQTRQEFGLESNPPNLLAIDDGMCDRLYMYLRRVGQEREVVLLRN